ncbi:hypothetical protein Tco_1547627 [Tanacetum coccineum]
MIQQVQQSCQYHGLPGGGTRPRDYHEGPVHISVYGSTTNSPIFVIQPAPASKSNEIPERNPHQPPIPYPLRLNKDKLQDKSDIQIHKFLQMFKKLHFNICFAKAGENPNFSPFHSHDLRTMEELHKPSLIGPGHPHTVYYAYSDESDEDEPSEAEKSKVDPLIRESMDTFLMGVEEIKLNSHEDIDDLVPIPKVSEKPLDSLDLISKTFDITITNPLFDFDSEFTLNSDNPIFDIQNEESDESETETIMEEVQIHSS